MLKTEDIITFVDKFLKFINDPVELFWIGAGEVTLHPSFPKLINYFSRHYPSVRHYIQTNGIIDFVDGIERHDNLIIGVSLDGFKADNDFNRGKGTFDKIVSSINKFVKLGIKVNVHSIITPTNLQRAREFQAYIKGIDNRISVTFAPLYLDDSPDEIAGMKRLLDTEYSDIKARFGFDVDDRRDNKRYVCLGSDGIVFDCCELIYTIGDIHTEPEALLSAIEKTESCSKCKSNVYCYPEIFGKKQTGS